jgi:hypothetical protein
MGLAPPEDETCVRSWRSTRRPVDSCGGFPNWLRLDSHSRETFGCHDLAFRHLVSGSSSSRLESGSLYGWESTCWHFCDATRRRADEG